MLELSTAAAVEVAKIPRLDGEEVLRVWRKRSSRRAGVTIGFVRLPREDDQVGISRGIPICVGRDIADALDDMVLDVRESRTDPGLYIRSR